MKFLVIGLILFRAFYFVQMCDIFIANKCPGSPAFNEFNMNATVYCKEAKDHVDCINKKLKQCKSIQEFGPALETIKSTVQSLITQV
jgi:hypothetical protein